jgi:hypothetical protein
MFFQQQPAVLACFLDEAAPESSPKNMKYPENFEALKVHVSNLNALPADVGGAAREYLSRIGDYAHAKNRWDRSDTPLRLWQALGKPDDIQPEILGRTLDRIFGHYDQRNVGHIRFTRTERNGEWLYTISKHPELWGAYEDSQRAYRMACIESCFPD